MTAGEPGEHVGPAPRVSVLVVNWNGRHYLQRCLDSIYAQTYQNVEAVLVDNGSTDGSVEYVQACYPHLLVVESSRNLGFAEGTNEAARHSSGEYLFLLNNDAWLQPNTISRLMQTAYIYPSTAIIGCTVLNLDGSIQDIGLKIDPLGFPVGMAPPREAWPPFIDDLFYVSGCALLIRADVFRQLGKFDGRYFMFCEDVDLAWRAHLRGYSVMTDTGAVVVHVSGGSMTGGAPGKEQRYQTTTSRIYLRERNTLATLLKNYSVSSLLRLLPLYVGLNILESLFFLLLLKPYVAWQYPRSYWWNVRQLAVTLRARSIVQRSRRVSDRDLARYLCPELQKLRYIRRWGIPSVEA